MRRSLALGAALLFGGFISARQALPARPASPRPAPAASVHQNCASCHRGHRMVTGATDLPGTGSGRAKAARSNGGRAADMACLQCHEAPTLGGPIPGAAPSLQTTSPWASSHLVGRGGATYRRTVRQGGRTLTLSLNCSGCHDPHGRERGQLRTVAFDTRGQLLERRAQSSADLCFGCHAGPEAVRLPSGTSDTGAFFIRGGGSSHLPGATAASRPDLPSLRNSAFTGRLDCTSCHDSPDPSGPRGPHSSPNPSLLKAPFGRERDLGRLGERVNDLCFQCHDRPSILANQSFPFHGQHLQGFTPGSGGASRRGAQGPSEAPGILGLRSPRDFRPGRSGAFLPGFGEPTACATCHASHGSPRYARLVEFDRAVVTMGSAGTISFQRLGLGQGTCTLSCHGYDHVQTRY